MSIVFELDDEVLLLLMFLLYEVDELVGVCIKIVMVDEVDELVHL